VRGSRGRAALRTAAIVSVTLVFLAPLVLVAVGSLRPEGLPPRSFELPRDPTLANYGRVDDLIPLARMATNSVWVAAVAVPLSVVVASMAGFAAARLPRGSGAAIVVIAIVAFSMPAPALAVGRALVYRSLGVSDGPWPLLFPSLLGSTPIAVLIFAWRYRTLPSDVWDLAREAGLPPLSTWLKVAVPMTWHVTGAVAALVFVVTWGNVLDPLFFIADPRWATLPMGIRSLAALPSPSQPVMLAGAVLAALPALVIGGLLLRHGARTIGGDR
jgi:multiple sugar transport system permease protein